MGSGLAGLLYLNGPLLLTSYLLYTFSTDLILSAIVFILGTKFRDNLEVLEERHAFRGVVCHLWE